MGLAAACAFAQSGASIVLADRDAALAEKEAVSVVAEGGVAIGVACDVTDEAQIAAADEPVENFQRVVAANQFGVWASMKHELRVMRSQESGAIVNNSSLGRRRIAGRRRLPRSLNKALMRGTATRYVRSCWRAPRTHGVFRDECCQVRRANNVGTITF
jgi:NAD(P)-dependent dehydrogenase (short-subunit alcohol dehydrogenase family)